MIYLDSRLGRRLVALMLFCGVVLASDQMIELTCASSQVKSGFGSNQSDTTRSQKDIERFFRSINLMKTQEDSLFGVRIEISSINEQELTLLVKAIDIFAQENTDERLSLFKDWCAHVIEHVPDSCCIEPILCALQKEWTMDPSFHHVSIPACIEQAIQKPFGKIEKKAEFELLGKNDTWFWTFVMVGISDIFARNAYNGGIDIFGRTITEFYALFVLLNFVIHQLTDGKKPLYILKSPLFDCKKRLILGEALRSEFKSDLAWHAIKHA